MKHIRKYNYYFKSIECLQNFLNLFDFSFDTDKLNYYFTIMIMDDFDF